MLIHRYLRFMIHDEDMYISTIGYTVFPHLAMGETLTVWVELRVGSGSQRSEPGISGNLTGVQGYSTYP